MPLGLGTIRVCLQPGRACIRASLAPRSLSGVSTAATGSTIYEGSRAVDEYLQMHFGTLAEVFPYSAGASDALRFPERCADQVLGALQANGQAPDGGAVLDVGCAVGGASFSLAQLGFARVDAVDFSNAFIDAAQSLQRDGKVGYTTLAEGARTEPRVAQVPGGPAARSQEVLSFSQGDACALEPLRDAGTLRADGYDAVLAANLLCRLPRPRAFLQTCSAWLVRPGGVLVLLTPFSWLEQWTPQSEWIGGGEKVSSEELEREMTSLGFGLRSRSEVPFLIREHARKFQYGVSECTVWRRSC